MTKARVAIIEDHGGPRRTWSRCFQASGRCSEVFEPSGDFESALHAYFEDPASYFDIFVLDLHLGGSASDGTTLWRGLIEKLGGQKRLGKLVIASQRVEGDPVESLLTEFDAVQCTESVSKGIGPFAEYVLDLTGQGKY